MTLAVTEQKFRNKPLVTRFNPTTNGDLHIGHAYMALVNQDMARSTSGLFHLRFDDNQPHWNCKLFGDPVPGPEVELIKRRQIDDLAWLDIIPDYIFSHYALEDQVRVILSHYPDLTVPDNTPYSLTPDILGPVGEAGPMGLSSWLAAEKVVLDNMQQVNCVIRGYEFISEAQLYFYMCLRLGVPTPWLLFIPRLKADMGEGAVELSKTAGNYKLRVLREAGIAAPEVLDILRQTCLVNPAGLFVRNNLKLEPIWFPSV